MSVNDALYGGKPNAGSLKLIVGVVSLKDRKQLAGVLQIETDTIVFDIIDILIFFDPTANFNNSRPFGSCEFDSIGQEINKDLPDH
jgi:hypothetical protein